MNRCQIFFIVTLPLMLAGIILYRFYEIFVGAIREFVLEVIQQFRDIPEAWREAKMYGNYKPPTQEELDGR